MDECSVGSLEPSPDCGNQRLGPGPGLDLSEVKNDVLKNCHICPGGQIFGQIFGDHCLGGQSSR